jgi:hypothetical protein
MIFIKVIRKLIKQGEEEWKQQRVIWKAQGVERGYKSKNVNVIHPSIVAKM